MLAFLSRCDAAVQRTVDSAAFTLMRRLEWKKAYLRYCLLAISCVAMAGNVIFLTKMNGFGADQIMSTAILVLWLALTQFLYVFDNRNEDRRSILYLSDVVRLSGLGWQKCLWTVLLAWELVCSAYGQPIESTATITRMIVAQTFCLIVKCAAILLELYLVKTPRIPPPLEEKQTALVPATARI